MKKKFVLLASGIIVSGLYLNSWIANDERDTDILLSNIEALSETPEKPAKNPTEYWCCGTTAKCLEASNLIIVGHLSFTPCKKKTQE